MQFLDEVRPRLYLFHFERSILRGFLHQFFNNVGWQFFEVFMRVALILEILFNEGILQKCIGIFNRLSVFGNGLCSCHSPFQGLNNLLSSFFFSFLPPTTFYFPLTTLNASLFAFNSDPAKLKRYTCPVGSGIPSRICSISSGVFASMTDENAVMRRAP